MIYTLDGELHLQDVPTPLLHKLILCAACAVKLEKARRAAEKEKEAAHAPQ